MYSEITEELFKRIVTRENRAFKYEELELANKTYWRIDSVIVLAVTNYITSVTQYFVQDINASIFL